MLLRAKVSAVIAIIVWATAFVAIQEEDIYFSPMVLAFARDAIATLAVLIIWLIRGEGFPQKKAWPGIFLAGLLWFGLYMFCVNWAEDHVDASVTSVLVKIGPIFIAIFSAIWLKERLSKSIILGIILSFSGVVIIGLAPGISESTSLFGIAICLAAALLHAVSVVLQKNTLNYCSALQFNVFSMLIASIVLSPCLGTLINEVKYVPPSAIWSILYIGLVPTALGFLLWTYALSHSTAGKMGVLTFGIPIFVIIFSWLWNDEIPGKLTLGGALICFIGIIISWKDERRPRKSVNKHGEYA